MKFNKNHKTIINSLVASCMVGASIFAVSPAFATNLGSHNGNNTQNCDVNWAASSVLDTALTNDDPTYPNLMVGLDGKPISGGVNAYTNGGYITEVRPEYGDSGIFEINHFYLRDVNGVWRIPVATDHTINNAKVIVALPAQTVQASFDGVSTNSTMSKWRTPYTNYSWSPQATNMISLGNNQYEVDLGTLKEGTGTVFQINFSWADGTPLDQHFVSSAVLTGSYTNGEGCTIVTPTPTPTSSATPTPTPTPTPTSSATPTPTQTPSATTIPTATGTPVNTTNPSPTVSTPTNVPSTPTNDTSNAGKDSSSLPESGTKNIPNPTPTPTPTSNDANTHPNLANTGGHD